MENRDLLKEIAESHFGVELRRVRSTQKVFKDQHGRIFCLEINSGGWHGFVKKTFDCLAQGAENGWIVFGLIQDNKRMSVVIATLAEFCLTSFSVQYDDRRLIHSRFDSDRVVIVEHDREHVLLQEKIAEVPLMAA